MSDVIRGMSVKSTLKGTTMSETNKANTVAFHKKAVFEGDVENAFRPMPEAPIASTILSSRRVWTAFASLSPGCAPIVRTPHGEIKRVFADGNYPPQPMARLVGQSARRAVVDIYRLENGKVVEHWDVIQPIPETAANNNTMF
jgi:predicted SnoaL-like aldol condensation-catalyzing enzyme